MYLEDQLSQLKLLVQKSLDFQLKTEKEISSLKDKLDNIEVEEKGERLLNTSEICKKIGWSRRTFDKYRNELPVSFLKNRIVAKESDLDRWIEINLRPIESYYGNNH